MSIGAGPAMKIGELARRSGLSSSRIRFYEAKGLLNVVSRKANGYRDDPADAPMILAVIARAPAQWRSPAIASQALFAQESLNRSNRAQARATSSLHVSACRRR